MNDNEGVPCKVTLYVQTNDGFDGLITATEVPSKGVVSFMRSMSATLKEAGFVTSSTAQRNQASTAAGEKADDNPWCQDCGGPTERKQGTAKNGKAWAGYFCLKTKDQPKERQHAPQWL